MNNSYSDKTVHQLPGTVIAHLYLSCNVSVTGEVYVGSKIWKILRVIGDLSLPMRCH